MSFSDARKEWIDANEWTPSNSSRMNPPSSLIPNPSNSDLVGEANPAEGVTWTVTFDAKREPMFMDERGGAWVPAATFDERVGELAQQLEQADLFIEAADALAGAYSKQLVDHSVYVRYLEARAALTAPDSVTEQKHPGSSEAERLAAIESVRRANRG